MLAIGIIIPWNTVQLLKLCWKNTFFWENIFLHLKKFTIILKIGYVIA